MWFILKSPVMPGFFLSDAYQQVAGAGDILSGGHVWAVRGDNVVD